MFELQLLPQCGSTSSYVGKSVPGVHFAYYWDISPLVFSFRAKRKR